MNETDFFGRLRHAIRPVIVDVWAPWCLPCRAMAPALGRLEQTYQGRVEVWRVNADEQRAVVEALGIRSIPTLVAFQAGQETWRRTGSQAPGALEALFAALAGNHTPRMPAIGQADRWLRLAVGAALLGLAWAAVDNALPLVVAGSVVLFSAVYDRCPLWRALTARWRQWRA